MTSTPPAGKRWRSVDEWLGENGESWADCTKWQPDRHAEADRNGGAPRPRRHPGGPAWKSTEERRR